MGLFGKRPERSAAPSCSDVHVVIPAYGQRPELRLALAMLVPDFRITVLDFDSLDGTAEFIDGVALALPDRIRRIPWTAEASLGDALSNAAENLAEGSIALVNPDAILPPESLIRLVEIAHSANTVGAVIPVSNIGPSTSRATPPFVAPEFQNRISRFIDVPAADLRHELEIVHRHAARVREANILVTTAADIFYANVIVSRRDVFQAIPWTALPESIGWPDLGVLYGYFSAHSLNVVVAQDAFCYSVGTRVG